MSTPGQGGSLMPAAAASWRSAGRGPRVRQATGGPSGRPATSSRLPGRTGPA
jgi:hypothetical protein